MGGCLGCLLRPLQLAAVAAGAYFLWSFGMGPAVAAAFVAGLLFVYGGDLFVGTDDGL